MRLDIKTFMFHFQQCYQHVITIYLNHFIKIAFERVMIDRSFLTLEQRTEYE